MLLKKLKCSCHIDIYSLLLTSLVVQKLGLCGPIFLNRDDPGCKMLDLLNYFSLRFICNPPIQNKGYLYSALATAQQWFVCGFQSSLLLCWGRSIFSLLFCTFHLYMLIKTCWSIYTPKFSIKIDYNIILLRRHTVAWTYKYTPSFLFYQQ